MAATSNSCNAGLVRWTDPGVAEQGRSPLAFEISLFPEIASCLPRSLRMQMLSRSWSEGVIPTDCAHRRAARATTCMPSHRLAAATRLHERRRVVAASGDVDKGVQQPSHHTAHMRWYLSRLKGLRRHGVARRVMCMLRSSILCSCWHDQQLEVCQAATSDSGAQLHAADQGSLCAHVGDSWVREGASQMCARRTWVGRP